jgi:hypothetical protein
MVLVAMGVSFLSFFCDGHVHSFMASSKKDMGVIIY